MAVVTSVCFATFAGGWWLLGARAGSDRLAPQPIELCFIWRIQEQVLIMNDTNSGFNRSKHVQD
jgi:hypothetical protein